MTHSAGRIGHLNQQMSETRWLQSGHCSQFITAKGEKNGFQAQITNMVFLRLIQEDLEGEGVHQQTGWEFHNAQRHKQTCMMTVHPYRKTKTFFAKFLQNENTGWNKTHGSTLTAHAFLSGLGCGPVLVLQAGQGALELLLVLVLQVGQQHVLSAG